MSLLSIQCRAARALLGWSQADLAKASSVSTKTLADFEAAKREPYARTLADVRSALEEGGIVFLAPGETTTGGHGVRLRKEKRADDHPEPKGPATEVVKQMDAAIGRDRGRK